MPRAARRNAPTYITRSRGVWQLRFRYVDSRGGVHWPREVSPYPQDEARSIRWAAARRVELVDEIERDLAVEPVPETTVTLGRILDLYEADCRERGVDWDHEADRVAVLRASLGAATPVEALTVQRIAEWRGELRTTRARRDAKGRSRPLSARSANAYTTILQAALNLAVSHGLVASNVLRGLRRLAELQRTPPALSQPQVAALLAALDDFDRWKAGLRRRVDIPVVPIRTRVLIGYWTGGRPMALDALRWRQVDLTRGHIVYDAKGHRNIVVPVEPQLAEHLAALHAATSPRPLDLVMPGETGLQVTSWRKTWSRVVALANLRLDPDHQIPVGTPIHVLRHSRITHLLEAHVAPQAVAQITGTSIAMLQRHYAHLMAAALERELDAARGRTAFDPRRFPVADPRPSDPRAGVSADRHGQTGGQTDGQTEPLKTHRRTSHRVTCCASQVPRTPRHN